MRSMKSIVASALVVLLLVSGFVTYRWVGSQRQQAAQPSVAVVAAVPTAPVDADAKAAPADADAKAAPADADAGKDGDAEREQSLDTFLAAHPNLKNKRAQPIAFLREKLAAGGGESSREATSGPAQEQYDNRAYPEQYITPEVRSQADTASEAVAARYAQRVSEWQLVGPRTGTVPGEVTYTGRTTTTAGRVTALAVAPNCSSARCGLYMGAAGGGVWYTNDALYPTPIWKPITEGIDSTAIGSLYIDGEQQSDTWTIYAGTGEPNGSSDSEAGVGLYRMKNTDSGWTLVPGSVAVARDRSIAGIAIDPKNKQHIWVGTAVARHGSSAVNGGRFTPPNAPTVGLYESLDGGQTFTLAFSVPADKVNPNSANGGDFFRGGISKLQLDPQGRLYFSVFSYGLYRAGSSGYEQVFASAGEGDIANSAGSRTEFALAPMGQKLRIYLGDTNGADPAEFYRVDDANVAAAQLTDGSANAGWLKLSNEKKGTPGFASYDYCSTQCSYDMPVASPPGSPDVVYIGGQMQYAELGVQSNGRAIQRSADAGVDFTDMTNDAQSPEPLGMHPDQHAIAFAPFDPNIAFFGSDGGVVRISGEFVNHSADCAGRNLADAAEVTDCKAWLSAIPTQITSLNEQLSTLQFQSVAINAVDSSDLMGGTQDNGTWAFDPNYDGWFETVGGDGGQSGINPINQNIRVHSYYSAQHDVNFRRNATFGWNWISDPLIDSKEAASFYVPIITDPVVGGTMFDGLQHVWRTQDNGGSQEFLEQYCKRIHWRLHQPSSPMRRLGAAWWASRQQ